MKPWRFLFCVAGAYVVGFIFSTYFMLAARLLLQPKLILVPFVFIVLLTSASGWLYFRKVRDLSWRARMEVILAWMLFILLADLVLALVVYRVPLRSLSFLVWVGDALKALGLFLVAYLTAKDHPKFSAPDLLNDVNA